MVIMITTHKEDGTSFDYIGATDDEDKLRNQNNSNRNKRFANTDYTMTILEDSPNMAPQQLAVSEFGWQNTLVRRWPFGLNCDLSYLQVDFPCQQVQINTIVGNEQDLNGNLVWVADASHLLQLISSPIRVVGHQIASEFASRFEAIDLDLLFTQFRIANHPLHRRGPIVIFGLGEIIQTSLQEHQEKSTGTFNKEQIILQKFSAKWMTVIIFFTLMRYKSTLCKQWLRLCHINSFQFLSLPIDNISSWQLFT